jgi:3-methylcrotonyl-CoA carboxylase alpha subunit
MSRSGDSPAAPPLPFASVLVANRGEIAVRIIRTARRMGLRTIAVYSDADRDALHVRLADEAHRIGPAPANASYLDIAKLIAVAKHAGAGAVHPGYGFVSERAELAEACGAAGIVFVGPPASAIRALGDKAAAKALLSEAGVPVVPGFHGEMQEPKFLRQKAYEIGYPVAIKAVAGGGGKGMRRVAKAIEFDAALAAAQREAQSAFGDARVLIEKWIERPRHIEVQVFADRHGNVVHLFERDCSAQRRHQKVMEEAPAPAVSADVRAAITRAAVAAARAVGYENAGTVEFIADGAGALRPDGFWFLEMNTRLQVEHPVTEAVTGLDLVEWQFRVAAGEPLPRGQDAIALTGHAVEARLYAEDPERNFLPSTGRLAVLILPDGEGIRVDSGVEQGTEVGPFYDPLLAKIIAHAPNRALALERLAAALQATVAAGPRTNLAFLRALAAAPAMRNGTIDTGFIERELANLALPQPVDYAAAAFAVEELVRREQARLTKRAVRRSNERGSPWDTADAFDFSGGREVSLAVRIDASKVAARMRFDAGGPHATVEGAAAVPSRVIDADEGVYVARDGRAQWVRLAGQQTADLEQLSGGGAVLAPMHGKVVAVDVAAGERVSKGQRLVVIEAMKMEHALLASGAGRVAEVDVSAGDQVPEGARLLTIEPGASEASVDAEADAGDPNVRLV